MTKKSLQTTETETVKFAHCSLGSSEHPMLPKTCHQNHQQDMGRARCSPALAAAPTHAVCVTNFPWEFLQIRNAFLLLTGAVKVK